ncbi:uncharacterized protein [Dysidea avara]|uniref:uncharacterized protein n=1 Tax=Dysidea avara TaxID=196820 RepID=UPI003319D843
MSDLKRGEALVIFLVVGAVFFALVALGAVLYEFIKLHSSRLSKMKADKVWQKRRISLCSPDTLRRLRLKLEGHKPPTTVCISPDPETSTDDQDVFINNDTVPSSSSTDEMQVVLTLTDAEVHAESADI